MGYRESLTALRYSVSDEVNAFATKMVVFKARLLCGKVVSAASTCSVSERGWDACPKHF